MVELLTLLKVSRGMSTMDFGLVLIGVVVVYLVGKQKLMDIRQNDMGKENEMLRVSLNKVITWKSTFASATFDIMYNSIETQKPVTERQVKRLKRINDDFKIDIIDADWNKTQEEKD